MDNYNYGIIGNCTSAALVSEDCSIDWLCLPFFDSPSIFAKILDEKKGGFFKISAVNLKSIKQEYVKHTAILKTIFTTKNGVFEVRDYMPRFMFKSNEYYCPPEIHRHILVVSGKPKIKIELFPKPNYALSEVEFEKSAEYLKIKTKTGEYNSYYLYSNIDLDKIVNGKEIVLKDKQYILLSYNQKITQIDDDKIYIEYEKTKTYWLDVTPI